MKQEMLIKSLEQLLDHLHMMPDSPSDKMMKSMMGDMEEEKEDMPKKPEVKVVEMKAKLPIKKMEVEKEDEEEGEDEDMDIAKDAKVEALESGAEELEEHAEEMEKKAEEIEHSNRPKGLLAMLGGEDDPDMEEYNAKKKKALDAYMARKG